MLQVIDVVGGVGTVTVLDAPFGLRLDAVRCGGALGAREGVGGKRAAKAGGGRRLWICCGGAGCGDAGAVVRVAALRAGALRNAVLYAGASKARDYRFVGF